MEIIAPEWPAPARVRAFTTTRTGGTSTAPYDSFNLGDHVGDRPDHVAANRQLLVQQLSLPGMPTWPHQAHGTRTVNARDLTPGSEADAVYTDEPELVCAIVSADCLPIVIAALAGDEVAVVHGGWRGLLNGIVGNAVAAFSAAPETLCAWIGPGISRDAYTVDEPFRERFICDDETYGAAFEFENGRLCADLPSIAFTCLTRAGVIRVSRYSGCTVGEAERFFSYRRDGVTGRMATCAWLDPE